jgi:cation diffusion facilitator family transporter
MEDEARSGSRVAVIAALVGNVLVFATKTVAAAFTGSAAMLSEAVHSFVDTWNEVLLLYGMRMAKKRPDPDHPVGYGRELYFWSFVVAMLIFALGAGVSVFQGVNRILYPVPIHHPLLSEIVLALCFAFEGWSWMVSRREFRRINGDQGWYEAFRRSKDPPLFMVLFEDSAAMAGIVIAMIGTLLSARFGMLRADGVASVLIGLVLAAVSLLVARESKSLLIGERAHGELVNELLRVANEAGAKAKSRANGVLTIRPQGSGQRPDPATSRWSLFEGRAVFAPPRQPVQPRPLLECRLRGRDILLVARPRLHRGILDRARIRERDRPRQRALVARVHRVETCRGILRRLAA